MSDIVDVAVIGLGPTGAILSALLGQRGVTTVVMDKADDVFPLPRAIAFDHEVMRTVQNLGLADAVQPLIIPYPPTEYRGLDGRLIARYQSLPPPYPQGWAPNFLFRQPPFERTIRAALDPLPSVQVRYSTTLENIVHHEDHVALEIQEHGGARSTLRARYAVGCDGGASLVRKLLGLELETLDFDEPWLVVDVLVRDDRLGTLPESVVQYCDPVRPTTYVIGPGNHRRWEFMLLPGETPAEMNREENIRRLLGRWLPAENGEIWRASTYVFHALVAREWRRGRVLLAGDAAHMTPPFMAQGMCQGVRDAVNLAWKLALVLQRRARDALLDSYQHERRAHVLATTATAKQLGRIICELDPAKAAERDNRMCAERGEPPPTQYRQNLIPGLADGALASEQGAPVGELFPQPRIINGASEYLLDDMAGATFRLVVSSEQSLRDVPEALLRHIQLLGGSVLVLQDSGHSRPLADGAWAIEETQGVLATWFRRYGLVAALIRPDHYVLAVARGPSDLARIPDLVDRYLLVEPPRH